MPREPQLKPVPAIIAEIQRLSPLLSEIGEVLHAASGISPAVRQVLERLVDDGPATVPALAAALGVTRQNVQALVDRLIDKKLVNKVDNPRHKRSRLIAATDRGAAALTEIRAREAPIGAKLAAELDAADARTAASALATLRRKLEAIVAE